MKSKDDAQRWFPFWVDKWLFGSTRIELTPDQRGVWLDLMALGAKDNGYVRANPETAYLPRQLSAFLNISEELLLSTIERCVEVGKLSKNETPGIYYIKNWGEFQFCDRWKREFQHVLNKKQSSIKTEGYSEKEGLIVKDSIVKNSREEGNTTSSIFYECEFFKISNPHHEELLKEFPLINYLDLYKRLRNDCLDNPLRYKRNVRGHVKNLRNVLRNWCQREKAVTLPNPPEIPEGLSPAKVMVKCKWCGVVHWVKEDHQCDLPGR
jgi:hypothetical protein